MSGIGYLGYTGYQETICGNIVRVGRRAYRNALDYEEKTRNLKKKREKFKSGFQQRDLELLEEKYSRLENERIKLEVQLEQSKKLTLAWQSQPELHYDTWKNGYGMGAGWCGNARAEMREDLRRENRAIAEYNQVFSEIETLKRVQEQAKKYVTLLIPKVKRKVAQLRAELQKEEQARNLIMSTYSASKIMADTQTQVQANQYKGENKDNNMLLLGGLALGAIILIKTKKDAKKS